MYAAVGAQAKAWMDRTVAGEWAERTLKKHLKEVGGLDVERVLFMDNLDAQARNRGRLLLPRRSRVQRHMMRFCL